MGKMKKHLIRTRKVRKKGKNAKRGEDKTVSKATMPKILLLLRATKEILKRMID